LTEKNTGEIVITGTVLVFAIYPFTKDYLTENKLSISYIDNNTILSAYFLAIFFSIFVVWFINFWISRKKKGGNGSQ